MANFSLKEGLFFKEKQRKSGSDERYLLLRTTPQPSAPNFFGSVSPHDLALLKLCSHPNGNRKDSYESTSCLHLMLVFIG